jgi:hypothetical protein
VSPAEVARLLPYAEAVDELRAAFSEPRRDSPERVRVEIPRGELRWCQPSDPRCELPAATLAQALLTVEDRGAALVEAGDIIQAIAERAIGPGHIAGDLTDLARGAVGRSSAEQVTVFKSVGIADEDLVLVRMIARRLGVGRREATMYKRRLP